MAALLEAENLVVRFGGVAAVDGVSLAIEEGELLGIIGPNGAGKTTLLKLLSGILRADSGRVLMDGRDVSRIGVHARTRRGLALTHQIVRPFRGMTVLENVMVASGHSRTAGPLTALRAVSKTSERESARRLLEQVGLAPVADRLAGTLALGQLKRLEVARALALEPKIILLDEPLAGLNSGEAGALAETIAELNATGLTVALIEHNLGEVLRISRRLLVLVAGKVVADGAPQSVIAEPVVQDAYVGTGTSDAEA